MLVGLWCSRVAVLIATGGSSVASWLLTQAAQCISWGPLLALSTNILSRHDVDHILLPVSSVGCITTLWLATKVNVTHGLAVLSECLGRVTRQICLSLFCRRVSADVMRSIHAQFKQSTPVYNMYFRMQIGQDDVCKT